MHYLESNWHSVNELQECMCESVFCRARGWERDAARLQKKGDTKHHLNCMHKGRLLLLLFKITPSPAPVVVYLSLWMVSGRLPGESAEDACTRKYLGVCAERQTSAVAWSSCVLLVSKGLLQHLLYCTGILVQGKQAQRGSLEMHPGTHTAVQVHYILLAFHWPMFPSSPLTNIVSSPRTDCSTWKIINS